MAYYRVGNGADSGSGGGGGGESLPSNLIMGDFTAQSDLTEYTVTHNKGVAPVFAVLYAVDMPYGVNYAHLGNCGIRQGDITKKMTAYNTYQGYIGDPTLTYGNVVMENNAVTFVSRGGTYTFKTGIKYRYIIAFAENS